MNGLNEYDFIARWQDHAVPGFTTPDPLAEQYPDESPYLYCGNNPVNRVDLTGLSYFKNGNAVIWDSSTDQTLDYNGEEYSNIGDDYSNEDEDGTWSYKEGKPETFIENYNSNEANYSMNAFAAPAYQDHSGTSNGGNSGNSNQNSNSGGGGGSDTFNKIGTAAGVVSTDISLVNKTAGIIDELGSAAKDLSIAGHAGAFLGAASAGISTYKVVNQFQKGGISNVNGLDATDATVGWLGATASVATIILGTATPVGWVVIGGAATVYGVVRLGMFINNGE